MKSRLERLFSFWAGYGASHRMWKSLFLATVLLLVATGCRSYSNENRRLARSLPHYPAATLVTEDAGCGESPSGRRVCSVGSTWRMTRPDSEERVNDWFARHLTGWDGESSCGVGFTRRHALVEFTTAGGRELYVYVDAHGADHCDEIPAG